MSLLKTLAKVAVGIAVAKGVGGMMKRGAGQQQAPTGQLGGGAAGGQAGGGLGDLLGKLGGGAGGQGGGLGDLLGQLGWVMCLVTSLAMAQSKRKTMRASVICLMTPLQNRMSQLLSPQQTKKRLLH